MVNNEVKEDEMGRAYSIFGEEEFVWDFGGKERDH
jgi:phosphoenolpyruvate carboxylase